MNRIIFLLSFNFLCFVSNCQVEYVDGKLIESINLKTNDNKPNHVSAANDYINIYQKYISGIRGQDCPMFPSCSNFGLKVFSENNIASAFLLTSDRLLRCGHEFNRYDLSIRENGFKQLDYPSYEKPPEHLIYKRNKYYYSHNNVDSTFQFVKKLINNQYYQEALLEIMRIEFKSNEFNLNLFINKIICLNALNEYEKALFEYEKCPNIYKTDTELLFQISLIYYKMKDYVKAIEFNKIAMKYCNNNVLMSKIILLNGVLYANNSEWINSMNSFKFLRDFENYEVIADANYKLVEKSIPIKNKRPLVAGTLSIIPGLGYYYSNHKQTAFTAFFVNSLLAYATYTNFKTKNYGMGILTGVFNLSFYIGNIYGGVRSAKRYNENNMKTIINKLEFNTNF